MAEVKNIYNTIVEDCMIFPDGLYLIFSKLGQIIPTAPVLNLFQAVDTLQG
jgi:hypothetical protein